MNGMSEKEERDQENNENWARMRRRLARKSRERNRAKKKRSLVSHIRELRDLVKHCWIYSGYEDCGYSKMDASQRALYDRIVGRKKGRRNG